MAKTGVIGLIRYEAACLALSKAVATDEVKLIRDKADAMRAAAKIANNKQLEVDAAEIRIRAERRLGELLKEQADAGMMAKGAKGNPGGRGAKIVRVAGEPAQITLAEAGIDKSLANRSRKLAAVPEAEFEQELSEWRDRVSSENSRVTTRLEQRGEEAIESTKQRAECNIPDSAIVSTSLHCPTCGQRWPEGRPIHG